MAPTSGCTQDAMAMPHHLRLVYVEPGQYAIVQCNHGYRFETDSDGILWCNSLEGEWAWEQTNCVAMDPDDPMLVTRPATTESATTTASTTTTTETTTTESTTTSTTRQTTTTTPPTTTTTRAPTTTTTPTTTTRAPPTTTVPPTTTTTQSPTTREPTTTTRLTTTTTQPPPTTTTTQRPTTTTTTTQPPTTTTTTKRPTTPSAESTTQKSTNAITTRPREFTTRETTSQTEALTSPPITTFVPKSDWTDIPSTTTRPKVVASQRMSTVGTVALTAGITAGILIIFFLACVLFLFKNKIRATKLPPDDAKYLVARPSRKPLPPLPYEADGESTPRGSLHGRPNTPHGGSEFESVGYATIVDIKGNTSDTIRMVHTVEKQTEFPAHTFAVMQGSTSDTYARVMPRGDPGKKVTFHETNAYYQVQPQTSGREKPGGNINRGYLPPVEGKAAPEVARTSSRRGRKGAKKGEDFRVTESVADLNDESDPVYRPIPALAKHGNDLNMGRALHIDNGYGSENVYKSITKKSLRV